MKIKKLLVVSLLGLGFIGASGNVLAQPLESEKMDTASSAVESSASLETMETSSSIQESSNSSDESSSSQESTESSTEESTIESSEEQTKEPEKEENVDSGAKIKMNRLYNPVTSEHFYTSSSKERNWLVINGWQYEGIGWMAPENGEPVYRLYDSRSGDHHYTVSAQERDYLVSVGWTAEGVGWHSSEKKEVPLYRSYNPNLRIGSHHYTSSKEEHNSIAQYGWKDEGISWYGILPDYDAVFEGAKSAAINQLAKMNLKDTKLDFLNQVDMAQNANEINQIISQAMEIAKQNDAQDLAKATIHTENFIANKGKMDVIIADVQAPFGVDKVEVAIWSATNQENLHWYTAQSRGDGTYKVSVDFVNHQLLNGDYQVHVYITQKNKVKNMASASTIQVQMIDVLNVQQIGNHQIRVSLEYPASIHGEVRFPVWSDLNGQTDIRWYTARHEENRWVAEVNISNHDVSFGKYHIHAYDQNGFISDTIFRVDYGYHLNVPLIGQLPELPTGCEATALTMMYSFKQGKLISKTKVADELPRHPFDPNQGYVGNPYLTSGWTIYPPALGGMMLKYTGGYRNLTGVMQDTIKEYIKDGKPVVVWAAPMHGFSCHALTITGFDGNHLYYNDPWTAKKDVTIRFNDFEFLWRNQSRRAISY